MIAVARERGYIVDTEGFNDEMQKQQSKSGKKTVDALSVLDVGVESEFTGYSELQTKSVITALVVGGVDILNIVGRKGVKLMK